MTRIGIFQYAARDESPADRLERLDAILASQAMPLDAVVCPELFLSGYGEAAPFETLAEPVGGPSTIALGRIARRHRVVIVAGYAERVGHRLYNSALCISAGGDVKANYRKRNIAVGFERDWFLPGEAPVFLKVGRLTAAVLICYDVEFPERGRQGGRRVDHRPDCAEARMGIR